jgi:hypothetical protein
MANPLGDHTISWHDGESDRYTDILPFEWFKDEGSRLRVRHDVEWPRSGRCGTAKCNVNVRNKVAILDYRPFKKENDAQDMLLGVLRLDFASLSRKTIRKVQWKDSGQRSFSDRLITIHGRPRDDVSLMNYKFESSVTAALQLSSKELSRRLDKAPILPRKTMVATQQYNRSVYVAAKVHKRAKGWKPCSFSAPRR